MANISMTRNMAAVLLTVLGIGVSGYAMGHEGEGHVSERAAGSQKRVMHLAGEHDLAIGGGVTMISQRLMSDVDESVMNYSIDLAFESDLGEWGQAFIYMIGAEGADVQSNSSAGVNADFEAGSVADGGFSDMRIAEAWIDVPLNARAGIRVGKIDATGIFDANEVANDQTTQFMAGTFVNNVAIPFPAYTAGLNLGVNVNDHISFNAGAFESSGEFTGALSNYFSIGEVALAYHLPGGDGNLRISYWDDEVTGGSGYAASADQRVTETITAFARYGAIDAPAGGFDAAFSLGAEAALGENTIGLGYANAAAAAGADEQHVEVYYSQAFSDHFHIAFDMQQIRRPGFSAGNSDETIYGARLQLEL